MLLSTCAIAASLLGQPSPAAAAPPIDPCQSVIIAQTRAALETLRSAEGTHLGRSAGLTAAYEGTVSIEGHLMRPGTLHTVPVRLTLTLDHAAEGLALKEVSGPAAKPATETTLILGGRVARQPAAGRPFVEVLSTEAPKTIADAARWLPAAITRAALRAAPSCRLSPPVEVQSRPHTPITFADAAGHACTILLDDHHRVARIESLAADHRLGDVCDWTAFDDWRDQAGVQVPGRIARFMVQGSITVRYDLTLASLEPGSLPASDFLPPEDRRADLPTWGQQEPAGLEFVPLAKDLWSVEIAAANTRILVIERDTDLVVIDAPDGDAIAARIIAGLKDRFPGKAIGLVAFGHHHPSPSGGLRAMAAAGATIVCPRELETHVRALLARPATLGPPAVPGPAEPRLQLFDGDTTIDGGPASVRLINIAERSAHAFSYVVFYFPESGLLFEDDLGYFPVVGEAQANPRLRGLADALAERHIEPKRLVQEWPVKNAAREVEWSVVAELVKAERAKRRDN